MCRVQTNGLRRVLGGCAVAGPIVFAVASLVAESVQDAYGPRREDISALAALDAQHAWIMIAGIIVLGLSIVGLGLGLVGAIRDGKSALVGAILLVLTGLAFVTAGVARNDCSSELQACKKRVNAGEVSWHHKVHDAVGFAALLLLVVAPFVFARASRADSRWITLRRYSLITGVLALALALMVGGETFTGWNGLLERALVAVTFVWIAVLGWRLARIASATRLTASRQRLWAAPPEQRIERCDRDATTEPLNGLASVSVCTACGATWPTRFGVGAERVRIVSKRDALERSLDVTTHLVETRHPSQVYAAGLPSLERRPNRVMHGFPKASHSTVR